MLKKKVSLTTYEQASLLREGALTGFRTAYDTLAQSNVLIAQDVEEQRLAAIAYREELENQIRIAERRQADALALEASNKTSIDLLAKLLG